MSPSTNHCRTSFMRRLWTFLCFSVRVFILEWKSNDMFLFTFKRVAIFLISVTVFTILMFWNHVGFCLDDVFFPHWRISEVKEPLFLVGNARSGTTWLHRLITLNSKRFTTMKTWEIAFAASITWRWLFGALYNLDSVYLGSIVFTTIMYFESIVIDGPGEKSISREAYMHPTGLMEAEEDEWLMVHAGCSQLILFCFPLGNKLINDIIMFDCAPEGNAEKILLKKEVGMEIFAYYKNCVRRHVYFHSHYDHSSKPRLVPAELTFVSKNPAFTLRIPTIYETFPDARIVSVLRDPIQSIPSMISYISKVWHTFTDPVEEYPDARQLVGCCRLHYLFPLLHLREGIPGSGGGHPVNQWAFVSYHHLLTDLETVVLDLLCRLYGPQWALHSTITTATTTETKDIVAESSSIAEDLQDFKTYLRAEQVKASFYKTQHVHSVAQCCGGMIEEELREELRTVYAAHKGAFT